MMKGYRESFGSLPKMEDFAIDLQTCEALKIDQLQLLDTQPDEWVQIYRKMTEAEIQGRNFVINVMRREPKENEENPQNIKV
jgi:hypothetical protein